MYVIVNEPVYNIWDDIMEEYRVPNSEALNNVIAEAETNMDAALIIDEKLNAIFDDIDEELVSALTKFPPFNSAHEGFSVLNEEVDELWEHVRGKQGSRSVAEMRKEAVQVAAMAIRFVLDVCDSDRGQK